MELNNMNKRVRRAKKFHSIKYNNFKFVPSTDGTGADLVSTDNRVDMEMSEPKIIEVHNDTDIDLE